ncbi:hypothetical protein EVAR_79081_1, partial [Eumeta japonica]
ISEKRRQEKKQKYAKKVSSSTSASLPWTPSIFSLGADYAECSMEYTRNYPDV